MRQADYFLEHELAVGRVPAARVAAPITGRLVPAAVALAGALAGVVVALNGDLDTLHQLDPWAVARGVAVASFTAVGTYTWVRRPSTRFGARLAALGLVYAVASLTVSHDALLHTVGRVTLAAFVVSLAYLFLCFPHDALTSLQERRVFAWLAWGSAAAWIPAVLLVSEFPSAGPLTDCSPSCPDNAFQVATAGALARPLLWAPGVVTAAALVAVSYVLWRKAGSTPLRRRLLSLLLGNAIVLALGYAAYTLLRQAGSGLADPVRVVGAVAAVAVPWAMLVGQVRGRVFTATSLGQLVAGLSGEVATVQQIERLLREELGDPRLLLAVRTADGAAYVDARGQELQLPGGEAGLAVTEVERGGRPVLALVHDEALADADMRGWIAATALMLLENARLVDELRESRARIVATAQHERLRLERNLHDGAQQRLLTIQIALHAAMGRRGADQRRVLEGLESDVAALHAELVELARGLYPTVLRERGLGDGLRASARGAPLRVDVVDRGVGRLPVTVEEAVYFCVLEAIQNAAKHGGAGTRVRVTLERAGSTLEVVVADDGRGFRPATAAPGMGMLNMRDRIGAIGGELVVVSEPGGGSIIRVVVPLVPTATPAPPSA